MSGPGWLASKAKLICGPDKHVCYHASGQSYSVVQNNSCMFEFPAFLPTTNLGLPMHSPSALTEHVSLNFDVGST